MKLEISFFSKPKFQHSYIYVSLKEYSDEIGPHWYNQIIIYKR